MSTCPSCGGKTLFSTERADNCGCGYSFWYRDAYAEIEQRERQERLGKSKADKSPVAMATEPEQMVSPIVRP